MGLMPLEIINGIKSRLSQLNVARRFFCEYQRTFQMYTGT